MAQLKVINSAFHVKLLLCETHTLFVYLDSNDYVLFSNAELVFQPESASQPACTNISIVDDGILETNENFLVILSCSDRAVTIASSISTVNIINNDRK